MTPTQRFNAKVARQPNGCHLWTGALDSSGYGQVCRQTITYKAHRVAYADMYGPIPPGLVLAHSCDTPACVNPLHLTAVTQRANLADRNAKNRQASGTRNGQSKLNESEVRVIRDSKLTGTTLARLFGVNQSTIQKIKTRKLWSNLT